MHNCEYCHVMYQPRPQVKRPRACKDCQDKRQRDNEKTWRNKQEEIDRPDAKYFKDQREKRQRHMEELAELMKDCLYKGGLLLGKNFNIEEVKNWILGALRLLGVRRANKLWATATT